MNKDPGPVARLSIETTEGVFTASYSVAGLCRLEFPSNRTHTSGSEPKGLPESLKRWHVRTSQAVRAILAGKAPGTLPPLDLRVGTDFQKSVWNALCKIGMGTTRSYAEIAAAIGKPKATRAVGGACGANPIPLLVPCHRVLAANQKIGGFSGGLEWKRLLLGRERSAFTLGSP